MPRPARILFCGAYYHVFNRGVNKGIIFFDDRDKRVFLQLLGNAIDKYQLSCFGYCLMPNHFHIFLQTDIGNLDKFMQSLQSRYAQYINLKYGRVGSFFQGRYQSRIVEKDKYSLTLIRYIHRNPVGFRKSFEKYPWSSYVFYLQREIKPSWLNTNWILKQFHPNSGKATQLFHEFHLMSVPEGSDPSGTFDSWQMKDTRRPEAVFSLRKE